MDDMGVEVRNLEKRFNDVVAVNNISLQIRKNEFFSLLGPSGCGKTTTLRMIGGFENPTKGEIYISGILVNDIPPNKRVTNMVFQRLALFPHMDVYDNIGFGLRMKKLPKAIIKEKVMRALDLVELKEYGNRRISQISGGQQQRVAIARALVNEPAVLLLDEPLGALDLKLRLQMQIELKELQNRVGTTFIYVTHDQNEALTMSNRIAVMREGHIEQIGSGEEIYENPKTRFVASFIGETNMIEGVVIGKEDIFSIVDCQGLRIKLVKDERLLAGMNIAISIRPERVLIENEFHKQENQFKAHIRRITFKGSLIIYMVELPCKINILVQEQASGGKLYQIGDQVNIGWASKNTVALYE